MFVVVSVFKTLVVVAAVDVIAEHLLLLFTNAVAELLFTNAVAELLMFS
jgi:hypothetical protein